MGFFNNRSQINENDNDDDTLYNIIKIFNKKTNNKNKTSMCRVFSCASLYCSSSFAIVFTFSFHY